MKKLLIILFLFFWFFQYSFAKCNIDENSGFEISSFLNECKPETLVWTTKTYDLPSLKSQTVEIFWNISTVIWIIAVLMIVVAWMMMQFSWGDDWKIKKAKDIIKWTLIWVLIIWMAWTIVFVVINFIFGLWWS